MNPTLSITTDTVDVVLTFSQQTDVEKPARILCLINFLIFYITGKSRVSDNH